MEKMLVYYNEERGIIGLRDHHFDWEEGDEIMTDGIRTVVFGIFAKTDKNIMLAQKMMSILRRYQPRKKMVMVLDEDFERSGDFLSDMLSAFEHSHYELRDVRTQVWKSFDAQLDFVEDVLNKMD